MFFALIAIRTESSIVSLAIICECIVLLDIYRAVRAKKRKTYYVEPHAGMTEKEFAKAIIKGHVYRMSGGTKNLVTKHVLKRRILYTVIWAVINFIILELCYFDGIAVLYCFILTLIYLIFMLNIDTINDIYKKAKEQPDRALESIIYEECIDDWEKPVAKKVSVLCGFIIILSLVAVGVLNKNERFVFEEREEGMVCVKYRPSIFNMDEVTVPAEFEGQRVVTIAERAFKNHSYMREIKLPNTLFYIKGEAFMNCGSLLSIEIPERVNEIRGNTFEGCANLVSVQLHDDIEDIHAYAFKGCLELTQIELPPNITEIHAYTFENCSKLQEIKIPDGVTRIAAHAFYGCDELSEVFIPESVVEIGSSAFRQCESLKSIEIPSYTLVNERAFKESPTEIIWIE